MLKQLGISEPFPFCHGLRRDTFPVNGDSFWVVLAQCQKAPSLRELANRTKNFTPKK